MNESIVNLMFKRREDIKTIVFLRNKRRYNFEQIEVRNLLFVYAICLSTVPSYEEAVEELNDIRNQLPCNSENFYNSLLKKLESYIRYYKYTQKCRYIFSNQKLIELLFISNLEMKYLETIISSEEEELRQNIEAIEEVERLRVESEIEDSINHNQFNNDLKESLANANIDIENNFVSDEVLFSYKDSIFDTDI